MIVMIVVGCSSCFCYIHRPFPIPIRVPIRVPIVILNVTCDGNYNCEVQ